MFVVYCVASQEFHPPMYLQTLKNWKVNDTNYKAMLIRLLEDKFFILQEIFSQAILPCANKFWQYANYKVFIPQMFFALANKWRIVSLIAVFSYFYC